MPQTAVETFRVGQKPRAYRASRAQGGDSRGQISQMPPPEFEVMTKIGRDRMMPGWTKCWRKIVRSEKMCQIEWS